VHVTLVQGTAVL